MNLKEFVTEGVLIHQDPNCMITRSLNLEHASSIKGPWALTALARVIVPWHQQVAGASASTDQSFRISHCDEDKSLSV